MSDVLSSIDSFTTLYGTVLSGNLSSYGGQNAQISFIQASPYAFEKELTTAGGGAARINSQGYFTYLQKEDLIGQDSFSYARHDGTLALVKININIPLGAMMGTSASNAITGDAKSNVMVGLGGDDSLSAGGGNDRVYGGSGNDRLDGGTGADMLVGGTGDDTLIVDSAGDNVAESASEGSDTVLASVNYTLGVNIENLTLTGSAARASGNELDNIITGNKAKNTLNGGFGADQLFGGAGDDTYIIDSINDVVTENALEGTDTVQSFVSYTLGLNTENLTLLGTDALEGRGNELNNTLVGNGANNFLDGGVGADKLSGGAGDDIYVVDNIKDAITEAVNAGADTVHSSINYVLGANVENLILTGENALTATGNALNNIIKGNNGNNTLNGGTGADTLAGGLGDDKYIVDNAGDVIIEEKDGGTDTVEAQATYTLGANVENLILAGKGALDGTGNELDNILTGNGASNNLTGGDGNDTLNGGGAADKLWGGLGNDTYIVDNGGDAVNEAAGEGIDTVKSEITYTLGANVENLVLTGARAANGIGNALDNTFTGNKANNIIDGAAGLDTVILTGKRDDYTVSYNAGNSSYTFTDKRGYDGTDTFFNIEKFQFADRLVESGGLLTPVNRAPTDLVFSGQAVSLAAEKGTVVSTITGLDPDIGDKLVFSIIGGASDKFEIIGDKLIVGNAGFAGYLAGDILNVDVRVTDASGAFYTETLSVSLTEPPTEPPTGNTISGTQGNDSLTGTPYNDTIYGLAGNDTIEGLQADDIMDGGTGIDTLSYAHASTGVTVNLSTTTAQDTRGAGIDTVVNFENLLGSAFDDSLTGDGGDNRIETGGGNNTVNGGAGNDTVWGWFGNDILFGGAGDDFIGGNNGNDIIDGGEGNDRLQGGDNNDIIYGRSGDDTITAGNGDNIVDGGDGIDTLNFFNPAGVKADLSLTTVQDTGIGTLLVTNIENMRGTVFNDVLIGNAGDNVIKGGAGNDTLLGGDGVDRLEGEWGDDILEGGLGSDALDGGEGIDTVSYSSAASAVTVSLSAGTAAGGAGTDSLLNFENITGSAFDDTLTGNAGDNILTGGGGIDTMIGGKGNDTYILSNSQVMIFEAFGEGTDTVLSDLSYGSPNNMASVSLDNNVENIVLTGSHFGGAIGTVWANKIIGNEGANRIKGYEGNDILIGSGGNDVIEGGADNDVMTGGDGNDTVSYYITPYSVTVNLGLASAQNTGGGGIDTISGFENLIGSFYDDTLIGDANDNIINGGAKGNDILIGGGGNDTVSYIGTNPTGASPPPLTVDLRITTAQDTGFGGVDTLIGFRNIIGSNANDTLIGDANDNVIDGGNKGNDTLIGGDGIDTLSYASIETSSAVGMSTGVLVDLTVATTPDFNGHGGKDTISGFENILGSAYNDTLIGDDNNNVINGGMAGSDILTGGLGADTFIIGRTYAPDFYELPANLKCVDTITDFNKGQNDKIDIRDLLSGYHPLTDALTDFVQITDSGANSLLFVDQDGAGTGHAMTHIATLSGVTGLTDEAALLASGNLIVA